MHSSALARAGVTCQPLWWRWRHFTGGVVYCCDSTLWLHWVCVMKNNTRTGLYCQISTGEAEGVKAGCSRLCWAETKIVWLSWWHCVVLRWLSRENLSGFNSIGLLWRHGPIVSRCRESQSRLRKAPEQLLSCFLKSGITCRCVSSAVECF